MPAPTPITTADVPNSVTAPISAANKIGVAYTYNKWAMDEYQAMSAEQQASYTGPSMTPTQYILSRLAEIPKSWNKSAYDADLSSQRPSDKWADLTQAQRDQIKAILATVQ